MSELPDDLYAPLNHKRRMQTANTPTIAGAKIWTPTESRRRLTAYRILNSYVDNTAREWQAKPDPTHREYGDPLALVRRIASGVLSDEFRLRIEGADEPPPTQPVLPQEPVDPGEDASDIARRIYQVQTDQYETTATAAVDRWVADIEAWPGIRDRDQWLADWQHQIGLLVTLDETERDKTIPLGDGVLVFGFDPNQGENGTVTVSSYDPGFYFPDLDDDSRQYPTTVSIAYEFNRYPDGVEKRYVRLIRYELGPLEPAAGTVRRNVLGATVQDLDDDGQPIPKTADEIDWPGLGSDRVEDGQLVRDLPWGETTAATCYMTTAVFSKTGMAWHEMTRDKADEWERVDLGFNFVPVLHIPNEGNEDEHFGTSSLLNIVQLYDDLALSDKEIMLAAALAGTPLIAVGGTAAPKNISVAPGAVIYTGEGRMDVLDTGASIPTLLSHNESLADRLAVNSEASDAVMGRTSGAQVPSGVSLRLSFGPFEQMINRLRMVRRRKLELAAKMAQRIAMIGGDLEPGPVYRGEVSFGPVTPTDTAEIVDIITKLLRDNAISRSTGLSMASAAGIEFGQVEDELARIASEDHDGAKAMAEALQAEAPAYRYLGIDAEPEDTDTGAAPNLALPTVGDAPDATP